MPTIDDIRQRFPSAKGLTDGQIIDKLSSLTGTPYEEVAGRMGFYEDTPRGVLGATNDYAIEAANSAAGLVSSVGNMVSPGNRASQFIQDRFIKPGEARQSVPVQLAKRKLGRALNTDEIGPQVSGVVDYVTENPMLAASQAVGSFAPLGIGVKGAQYGAKALGALEKGAQTTGLVTGSLLSGAAAGGDAGGSAYDLVKETPWEVLSRHPQATALLQQGKSEAEVYETLATFAARRASVVPALIGGIAGATGAEKALVGGVRGLRGVASTTAKEFGGEFLEEGATQYFGQKEAAEFNPDINPMTGVAGAGLLGGILGAGTAAPIALANMQPKDLLKPPAPEPEAPPAPIPPPPQLGYDGRAGEIISFGDGSAGLRSELEAQQGFPRREPEPIDPAVQAELDAKAEQDRAAAERKQAILTKVEEVKQTRIAQEQAEQTLAAERTARAKEFGVELKGKAQLETFGALETALEQGTIDTDAYAVNLGLLGASKHGEVKKNLEAAAVLQRLVELRSTGVIGDPMFKEAEQDLKDGKVKQVEKFIDGWNGQTAAANAETTAKTTQPAANPGAAQPAVPAQPAAPGQQPASAAPVAPVQQPVAESPGALSGAQDQQVSTVTVGRKGREQTLTKAQLSAKMAAATPIDQARILDALGLEQDTDPTTGAPVFLQVAEPRTFGEVAELESQRTGKKVSKQAISQALLKFGITEDVVNATVGTTADTVSDAELGIDPAANGSGFRTETQLSKATGQGLVDDGNTQTKEQEKLAEDANKILKEAGPSTAVAAAADDAPPTNLPPGAKVTDLRDANPETSAQNIRTLLAHQEADNAAADWDGSTVPWETLPDTLKADWVTEYVWNLKANEGDLNFKELENAQANIERDFRAYQDNQGVQAPTRPGITGNTRPRSSAGMVERVEAPKPAVPAADAGSGKAAQTKVDPAKEAWDKERAAVPQMPAFESLNERQQKQVADLVSREQFNLAAANTVAGDINQDVLGPDVPVNRDVLESKGTGKTKGSTVAQVTAEVKKFLRVDSLGRNVFVVENLDGLPTDVQKSKLDGKTQGVAVFDGKGGRKVYLIASQIAPGKVKSVFLHEVGAHIGLEQLLSPVEFKALTDQLLNWARAYQNGSEKLEHRLASLALERTEMANVAQPERRSELLAYFIEESVDAGIDPTGTKLDGPVGAWLRRVMQAFGRAMVKLGIKPETLTAQDIVDLAYGAAEMEVRGTAATQATPAGVKESRAAPKVGIPSIDRAPEMVQNMLQSFKDGSSWLGIRTMFTEDLIALATKVIPSARLYKSAMDTIEVARGRMERDVVKVLQDFRALPAHEQGKGPGSVNQLLMDSTMEREWAFQPDWVTEKVAINDALADRFNAMSASGQTLVERVFKHGHDTLQQMQAAVQANVASEYDTAIAEATAAGDKAKATKLTNKKAKELADFKSMLDMRSAWPYAPLKRFGKHVVMGYSAEYAAAKAANNVKELQRLQKDGDHYYVAFAETKAQARKMEADIKDSFLGGETGNFEKLDGAESFMGGRDIMGAFQRLRTVFNDGKVEGEAKTNERIDTMMRQMYLTLLSETSARKSELHRRNVAGADGDMMRAFATQGRATAHFIAGLQTNGKINEHLLQMKAEAGKTLGDREQKQAYFNEIMRRHSMNLEYTPSGMIEKAMAGTSVWMLLSNPSYFLVNATQPFMMSAPLIGARYGYAKTNAEMFRAFKEVLPVLKDGKFTEDDYSTLPKDTQRAIEELANRGVIDISLESVLGKFESAAGSVGSKLDPVMQRMNGAAQAVESMNRLATAIAAYRLAKVEGGHDAAVEYAAKVIYETHGDYSGFNAPRFMRRGVGKLATQFRKFQLIQLSMFARLLNTAFKDASADERFIAKKALAYNLAHLGAAGGLMGMPAFSMIAWVIGKALPGDDEPDDPEATLRRLIGDKALADLLLKGAPKLLGVDISGRVGAGGMLSILPYTDIELSRDGYSSVVTGLLGPFVGGLMPKVVDGVGQISQGNLWKGTEQMLPTGLANVMKATRFADQGVTKRNGDVVLSADEVGVLDWAAQVVGLPTNVTTDRSFLANAQFTADKFYRERTSQLKNQYAAAVRKNDTDTMREVREDWMQTQAARRKLGYEVQPLSTLLKAPQEQRKREAATTAGVQTNRGNQGFIAPLQ
jgi:hypothetical protein